jgi:transposase
VTAADIQDRDGGAMLLSTLFGLFPFLLKHGGYQGPQFQQAFKRVLSQVEVQIVKRSDQAKGFVVLPRRWVVERTLAWLNRCRRLAKDWENLNVKARALLLLASIRLMVRRLCRNWKCFRTDSEDAKEQFASPSHRSNPALVVKHGRASLGRLARSSSLTPIRSL